MVNTRRCACPWAPRFFGLTHDDKELFLEPIFSLMYYMGFTYAEAYKLPLWQRHWFLKRINKEIKRSNKEETNASRALHQNTPEARQLQGFSRDHVPAKLRRFS